MSKQEDTIPKRFLSVCAKHPDLAAVLSKDEQGFFQPISFKEMKEKVKILAAGFSSLGVNRGDHVGMISDNRKEWYMSDIALLSIGAANVPRGSDSTADEIAYILGHADCSVTIAENKAQLDKILNKAEEIESLKTIVLFEGQPGQKSKKAEGLEILPLEELFKRGEETLQNTPDFVDKEIEKGKRDDLATIIYTSGTTGEPKGVMLTHRNFLFQVDRIYDHIFVKPSHIFLSVLPVWHSFERAVDYIIICTGATMAYSKPVGSIMLEDMLKVSPQWLASVPRIWEGVRNAVYRNINKEGGIKKVLFYFFVNVGKAHAGLKNMFFGFVPQFRQRVRAIDIVISIIPLIILTPFKLLGDLLVFRKLKNKLGGKFIAGISGGGALPRYVDIFFQAAGIKVLEGYGLTETGPILSVRKQNRPIPMTVGPLLKDIEYRVLDKDLAVLPPGKKGVLFVKSDQIMKEYYKRPKETEAVLKEGWLNTGDLAVFTYTGEFKIIGRAKETIVLLGGENIEPVPIEEKLLQSEYIDQVMVVGQDKKFLAALIVPNVEKVVETADQKGITYFEIEDLVNNPEIHELVNREIQSLVNQKTGFKNFEQIFRFKLLSKPFEIGQELTHSLKVRRSVVEELYKKEIRELFQK